MSLCRFATFSRLKRAIVGLLFSVALWTTGVNPASQLNGQVIRPAYPPVIVAPDTSVAPGESAIPFTPTEIWHRNERVAGPTLQPETDGLPELTNEPAEIVEPSLETRKIVAENMLVDAQRLIDVGEYQRARQIVNWVRQLSLPWDDNELSPERVSNQLKRQEIEFPKPHDPWPNPLPPNPIRIPFAIDTTTSTQELEQLDERLRDLETRDEVEVHSPPAPSIADTAAHENNDNSKRTAHNGKFNGEFNGAASNAQASQDSTILLPVIGFLTGVASFLLVVVVALVIVLRRFKAEGGSIFRVEIMNQESGGQIAFVPGASDSTKLEEQGEEPDADLSDPFVPGTLPIPIAPPMSTFADKRDKAEELQKQQEQALLKHLYEVNVELYEEISRANDKAA